MNKLRQRTLMREVVFITIYQLDYGIDMADLKTFLRRESVRAGLDNENRDRAVKYFDDIAMLRGRIDEVVKIHLDNWDFDIIKYRQKCDAARSIRTYLCGRCSCGGYT